MKNLSFSKIRPSSANGNMGVALGMSGGVDSTAAAIILLEMGYRVVGVTLEFPRLDGSGEDRYDRGIEYARKVCSILGIPHVVKSAADEFKSKVLGDFVCQYRAGRTPNPCVVCNEKVKFPLLAGVADDMSLDYISTGHYVCIARSGGGRKYLAMSDTLKDQSYFLYRIPVKLLERSIFPLGGISKENVKDYVGRAGLSDEVAGDSQDTCFLSGDVNSYLTEKIGNEPGDILDEEGKILGRHGGIYLFTVGQRRGAGISAAKPLYVKRIDPVSNQIILTPEDDLYGDTVIASHLKLRFRDPGFELFAKLRYRHRGTDVESISLEGNLMKLKFRKPQKAITPGQSLVLYNREGILVGGGIIEISC